MYLVLKAILDNFSLVRHLFLKLNLLKNLLKSCLFILLAGDADSKNLKLNSSPVFIWHRIKALLLRRIFYMIANAAARFGRLTAAPQ